MTAATAALTASATTAQIVGVEQRRQDALVRADLPELDRLFADDLVHVHSSGLVHDKRGFIEHVQRLGGFLSIKRGPLQIKIEGPIAIMTGRTINRLRLPETGQEAVLDGFVTQLLRHDSHGWRFFLSQLTLTNRAR